MALPVRSTKSSELARIAAEAAGVRTSSVRFTVTHGPAASQFNPGYDPVSAPGPDKEDPEGWPTDFCLFSAAGLSMSATTWPSAMSTLSGRVQIGDAEANGHPNTYSYSGLSVPNPGFLSESTHRMEVLLTVGNSLWSPTYRDCLMQALLIERLSSMAVERASAPLMHVHTPAAPSVEVHSSDRGDGSNERLRDAIGPCMRLSVGLDPNNAAARLDFETHLAALAEEFGFGLKLDDRRFNRVRGEWFTIRGFDRERYRQARNRLFPNEPTQPAKSAVSVSVIGPSRIGTTAAVTATLRARGIGVLAASISSMQKTTFINLILPVAASAGTKVFPWSGNWHDALPMLDVCATNRFETVEDTDDGPVADWKVAASAPIRCSYPQTSQRTGASASGRVPYPIWLWWQLPPGAIDTPLLLARVQANLAPHTRRCEVAYAQSRLVRGDVVRGRAKLIVLLAQDNRDHSAVQRLLSDATERAQERTREQLLALGRIDGSRARLRMSPRERWLADADYAL